jgi:hypothetical protein
MVKASMMIIIGSRELVIISQGTCTTKEVGIILKATEGTELGGAWGATKRFRTHPHQLYVKVENLKG